MERTGAYLSMCRLSLSLSLSLSLQRELLYLRRPGLCCPAFTPEPRPDLVPTVCINSISTLRSNPWHRPSPSALVSHPLSLSLSTCSGGLDPIVPIWTMELYAAQMKKQGIGM
eukprot:TRINITY_DN760_c0_g1_i3.p1 TRINITY_DN760_c0_g1~~TRINITY_DN760_c0_g1_i3.p1  ORF type:complete len:113 (-),score=17.89 TRINITY_DN760_c0_g1_i3:304-642(-)